jgi:hypothetical protein
VQLDGRFAFAKSGPGEELQTEIDGCRIESVNRLVEINRQGFARIEFAGVGNKDSSELGIDAPVSGLVGLG